MVLLGQQGATYLSLYCTVDQALNLLNQMQACGVQVKILQGLTAPGTPEELPPEPVDPEPVSFPFASILKGTK